MTADPALHERRARSVERVEAFLERAVDDGLLRTGMAPRWAGALLGRLLHLSAAELPALGAGQAADVLVETFLRGVGRE